MRRVLGIGIGLLVIFALLIAGARQIGHRQERDHFPLPSADGCWQGLCFLEMGREEMLWALDHHPGVNDVKYAPSASYFLAADLDGPTEHSFALTLTESRPDYWTLARETRLPLMRVGDVIVRLGPPDLILHSDGVALHYDEQRVIIIGVDVTNSWAGEYWLWEMRLLPTDSVYSISIMRREDRDSNVWLYDPPRALWHGFDSYVFPQ